MLILVMDYKCTSTDYAKIDVTSSKQYQSIGTLSYFKLNPVMRVLLHTRICSARASTAFKSFNYIVTLGNRERRHVCTTIYACRVKPDKDCLTEE